MKRNFRQMTGGYRGLKRNYRKKYQRRLLRPQYVGFHPRQFSRGEWKYKDFTISNALDTTGNHALALALAPGTGASDRIGLKVMVKSIELRFYSYVTATTGTDQIHRYMLVLDKQCNGALPGAPTVGFHLTSNSVTGMRNLAYRKRFRTLWDKTVALNASGEPGSFKVFKAYLKLKRPIVVEYNTTGDNTIASIASNALIWYTIGSQSAGGQAGATSGLMRIRYIDN